MVRFVQTAMGIPMSIDIREADPLVAAEAAAAAFEVLGAAERRFSRFRDDSEVQAVNRRILSPQDYSPDLREVLAIGQAAAAASGGAFTVRASDGTLDTDGVVKGWAAERAGRQLRAHGIRDFCLNAGGDVIAAGSPGGGVAWNVGVRSPSDANRMLAVLAVTDAAVATSGAYERGEHVIDGRTGAPARGLRSATVVADDLTTADVLATAAYALGEPGVAWALGYGASGVLALADDGRMLGAGTVPFAAA
ncbi:FAD:protein FMN transferase [Leifsonia poae]|uniref:FAD:protein FMN transferase n=1 Tax=Leifsonia poae TaxID=110933 RepID=A0A9W6HBR0_9MICO|nr:FAD:protein FMN transferase [Leifsonia poae]GLJ77185.1 FAD:protein FMN transferase [Leifsonia poae]